MIVGITGGTGCGKTTALRAFADLGGKVIDCDKVYHNLLETDQTMLAEIDARFPGTVRDHALDRKALGILVFSDKTALQDLNTITHHFVGEEVRRQLAGYNLVAIDAIALLESGLGKLCDVTVAITAPEELRIQRIMGRDNISESYAKKRIDAQKSQNYYTENCDYTLENSGTEPEFYEKCLTFFQKLGMIKEI